MPKNRKKQVDFLSLVIAKATLATQNAILDVALDEYPEDVVKEAYEQARASLMLLELNIAKSA